jgi:hypothetical protein
MIFAALDLSVTLSPEPMEVTRAVYGSVRGVGTWSARVCSEADERLTVSAVRIYAAAAASGQVRPIGRSRILAVLEKARYERPASRVARAVEWGLIGATALGAGQGVSSTAIRYLALGIPVAKRGVDLARERVPVFDSSELLDGEINLEPGACAERVMFSGVVKGARAVTLSLSIRRRPVVSSISSISPEAYLESRINFYPGRAGGHDHPLTGVAKKY